MEKLFCVIRQLAGRCSFCCCGDGAVVVVVVASRHRRLRGGGGGARGGRHYRSTSGAAGPAVLLCDAAVLVSVELLLFRIALVIFEHDCSRHCDCNCFRPGASSKP